MQIQRASEDQLPDLIRLFNDYRIFYGQTSDEASARVFVSERFENQDSVLFVAIDDGVAIGFTQLYPSFSSVGMKRIWVLNDLYVAKEHRRYGIAEALMDEAHRFAMEDGAARVELATQKNNRAAQELYDKMGYTRDDEFFHYQLSISEAAPGS